MAAPRHPRQFKHVDKGRVTRIDPKGRENTVTPKKDTLATIVTRSHGEIIGTPSSLAQWSVLRKAFNDTTDVTLKWTDVEWAEYIHFKHVKKWKHSHHTLCSCEEAIPNLEHVERTEHTHFGTTLIPLDHFLETHGNTLCYEVVVHEGQQMVRIPHEHIVDHTQTANAAM